MDKRKLLKVALLIVAIPLSLAMAAFAFILSEELGVRTPGRLASDFLVPPSRPPHEFGAVVEGIKLMVFVDWLFWFGVLCVLYILYTRLGRKPGQS
jgi:hypothetical protein